MLEKNRNTGSVGVIELMKSSACQLAVEIFGEGSDGSGPAAAPPGPKMGMSFRFLQKARNRLSRRSKAVPARPKRSKGGVSTLGSVFKTSLESLMLKLQSATPQFVRCIKPNLEKEPGKFVAEKVTIQLR